MADVLIVCRANVARSPLFAARLQLEAEARIGPGVLEFASAGVEASFGQPVAAGSELVAERWGRGLDTHRSSPISSYDLRTVALVLTMERRQRRDVVKREPTIAGRTFAMRELVAIVTGRIGRQDLERLSSLRPTDARARLRHTAALAHTHRPSLLVSRRHDVPDPIGCGQDAYDELDEEFTYAASVIAPVLFGPVNR